jgi:hypothetical protein
MKWVMDDQKNIRMAGSIYSDQCPALSLDLSGAILLSTPYFLIMRPGFKRALVPYEW